jgi:hypothetical protein
MEDNQVGLQSTLAVSLYQLVGKEQLSLASLFLLRCCFSKQSANSAMLCRREAERDAATEPLLSSFLYASILAHDSFERALAFVLSNRLANAVMLPTQLFETFYAVLISDPDVREGALADVEACRDRVG